MNAKKIMGAVLVALLAAALFVGAGAAADKGTFFTYQKETGLETGVWTGSNGATISVAGGVITPGEKFVPGTYKYNGNSTYVTYPTAAYAITGNISGVNYLVANGGTVYEGSNLTITITSAAPGVGIAYVMVGDKKYSYTDFKNNATEMNTFAADDKKYVIKAIFNESDFVKGVFSEDLLDKNALEYTVVGADEATISASVDTVYGGEKVTLTVAGTPGSGYAVNASNVTITDDQYITVKLVGGNYTFTMPNSGKASFVATIDADAPKEVIFKLIYDGKFIEDAEVKIKVAAPVVTATLGKPSYFIGDEIEVTGTSTAEDMDFNFTISGTNVANLPLGIEDHEWGKEWKANLTLPAKKLDVGIYTIKVLLNGSNTVVETISVSLKQPFISIADAPEVIAQDEEASFIINAEAADEIYAYFFGTNFFHAQKVYEDEDVANEFNVTLSDTVTNETNMATGQYFAVFQHPMYDGAFNIAPEIDAGVAVGAIFENTSGSAEGAKGVEIFNATSRQTANAAEALCVALDSQKIDDMYVPYSFFVVKDLKKDTFVVNPIPTEVVKGDKLVISGIATAYDDETVTVEMVSTAFAAVPKETVGSAAFVVATAKVAEDGTWEVTLDTSELNIDEYGLTVEIAEDLKESVTVNVVEAADEPVDPEQPGDEPGDEPEEPVAPETPGFGALAALAGLGAVAVLLLRRE